MSTAERPRHRVLRTRLHDTLGHGGVTKAAETIGKTRTHVSQVLNGKASNTETLDQLERWLDEIEREDERAEAV